MNFRTLKATKVVGLGAMLLAAALGWFLLVGPATAAINETNVAVADAEDRTMLLTTQLSSLQVQADDLSATRRAADGLDRMWPATADQPGFFDAVSGAASSAGYRPADITTLSPSAPVLVGPDGTVPEVGAATTDTTDTTADGSADPTAAEPATGWAVQTVEMSVTGGYDLAIEFLARLEELPRSILVQSIAMNDDGGSLVLTVTGTTFVASPVPEPDTEIDAVDGAVDGDDTVGLTDDTTDTATDSTTEDETDGASDASQAEGEGDGQVADPAQGGLAEAAESAARDTTADGS